VVDVFTVPRTNAVGVGRQKPSTPAIGMGSPSASSPMRLEKNGSNRCPLPLKNNPRFSRKNCRRSGKNTEKRVRLTTCRSTSVCPKSGLTL
jgi:hypothetical protein